MSRVALTLLLSLVVVACSRGRADSPPPADTPVPVRVAPVSIEAIARPLTATGTLGPKEEVTLSFKVGGVIGRVLVDEGQSVRAGETLALLDLSEIDAGVTRARSAAQKAERDVARARRPPGSSCDGARSRASWSNPAPRSSRSGAARAVTSYGLPSPIATWCGCGAATAPRSGLTPWRIACSRAP